VERPCDSEDTVARLVRIPKEFSDKEIELLRSKFIKMGWTVVDEDECTPCTIAFISPCGSWFKGYEQQGRIILDFPIFKAIRLGLYKTKENL
jgi:hypothetical protein